PTGRPWQLLIQSGCNEQGLCTLQRLIASVDLPVEGTLSLGDLELNPNGEVDGTVLLPEGTPGRDQGGIWVFLPGTPYRTASAPDGTFRLNYVPQGRVDVQYFHGGYDPFTSERVQIAGNGSVTTLAPITLLPASGLQRGKVTGSVQRQDAGPG